MCNLKFISKISESARIIGEICLNDEAPNWAEAEHWIKKAIDHDSKYGNRFYLMFDLIGYSRFYKRKNNLPKAQEQLTKAIDIMKDCGADGWVERYEKELAEFS